MRYYQGGWTSGQARQGFVNGSATRGEITFDFAGSVDVSNINITGITLHFTVGSLGGAYTKYLYLHTGSYNGTSVGNYSFTGCYNTSKSKSFSASSNTSGFNVLKAYIEGGGTKLGVYTGSDRGSGSGKAYNYDYMNITAMSLVITYEYKKSVGSVASAKTGSSATLKITAYNSAYSHRATWKLGSWSTKQNVAAGATSTAVTIPHSALPNATSGTATVTLETLNGSTSLGSNTYSFSVTVPSGVVPSVGSLTASPVNSGASSTAFGWGLYIQNRTKAAVAMGSVSAGSGASITAYSLTSSPNVGSASTSSLTTGLLTTAGTVTFTAKVTDSRGRTATRTATITVQAYAPPQFTATPSVYRCTSGGTRDDINGTYARLTASFSFSSVNSRNSLTVKRVALNSVNTNLTSGTAVTIGAGALALDSSYAAVITLTDAVGSTSTYTLTVPSAAYVLHVRKGGKSLGIGMAAGTTNNQIDVGWLINSNKIIRTSEAFNKTSSGIDVTAADNGVSESKYPTAFRVLDANGKTYGYLNGAVYTSGKAGVYLQCQNYDSFGEQVGYGTLGVRIDKSGNVEYMISANAFLKTLGLGSSGALPITPGQGGTGQTSLQAARNAMGLGNTTGALPIANGGTGATAVASQTLTLTSDFKAYSAETLDDGEYLGVILYSLGPFVELFGTVSPKASLASGAEKTITTIPSGYRPRKGIVQLCQGSSGNSWMLQVATNGAVIFSRYRSGASYTSCGTNVWLPFHACWIK